MSELKWPDVTTETNTSGLSEIRCKRCGTLVLPCGDGAFFCPMCEFGSKAIQSIQGNETRVTDPTTGGQKGSKPERFDLIPSEPLESLARVYGLGSAKYDDHNWRKGYKWSLSFAAMMRHAWAFWRGEDNDRESGQPHMAHAAWHCFTLLWFSQYRRSHDNRAVEISQQAKEYKV